MEWLEKFKNKDMDKLIGITKKPDKEEYLLSQVWMRTKPVIMKCFDGVKDLHRRNWHAIPFWLASAQPLQQESIPFRRYFQSDVVEKYAEFWQRYIIFCLLAYGSDEYGVEFTEDQKNCLNKVIQALNDDSDIEDIEKKIHNASVSLIRHMDWNQEKSSLLYFADILGYNIVDHRWKKAHEYTPTLAALLFCIRVIMLEYALPIEDRDKPEKFATCDPLQKFRGVRDIWLVEGQATPFSQLHALLNYGFKAGKDGRGRTSCRWSHDGKVLYFGSKTITITRWKKMVHTLLVELEQMLSSRLLFRTDRRLPNIDLNPINDNPDRKEAGHFFVKEIKDGFTQGRARILKNLSESMNEWKKLIDGQGFIKAGVDDYEHWDKEFREKLFQLMILTCGLSGRTKEMSSLKYVNTMEGERSIYLEDGQVLLVGSYHKSMAIMDVPKVAVLCLISDISGYRVSFPTESA